MAQTGEQSGIEFTFVVKQEASQWTALCLELDIASCGPTQDDAVESLKGLVDLYLEDCFRENDLPIPLRQVSREALKEFLSPPSQMPELSIISRRETFTTHAPA
jgi:predicted RNase H-like HicB family nuclease